MKNCIQLLLLDTTNWANFRSMNYHVWVCIKGYYHIKGSFESFALALFTPDHTRC